jgi:hypothetical protein
MATRRTTFDKLQRERAKRAKAAAKRERRQERSEHRDEEVVAPSSDSADDLLARIEDLHKRFEAKQISFEDFEAEKVELYERLAALPMD